MCEIPTALSDKKKERERENFADTGLAAVNISSVRVGLAKGTKRTPSQNWGNLLGVSRFGLVVRR